MNQEENNKTEPQYWQNKLGLWVQDPWQFACDVVYTKDAVDQLSPIKRFPQHFEYLSLFTKIWKLENRIGVPKSRRMFMSWYAIVLHLWDAALHPGRNIAFVSKKEDDANELVSRALFIMNNLKEEDWPKSLRPKFDATYNKIVFPELNSSIQGFPQGADQLRQFTFSRILADEMAFWEKAEDMYSSAMPTLEGGGNFMAISSAAPGFFKRLIHDELTDEEADPPKHWHPMPGVEVWRNARNKFVIFQLHYSANEKKRDPDYRARIKSDMPYHKYMQEYEISWETNQGKPVYPDWNKSVHGIKEEIHAHIGTPLFLGVDQGLMPGCVVFQPQGEDVVILCEYTAENMGAERFKEYVKHQLRKDFPAWSRWNKDFIVGMDPSAFNRRDVDERTYAAVWQEEFDVYPGEMFFEKRKQSVENALNRFRKGSPTFLVSLARCPILVRGFDGEYHYPDKMFEVEPNKARPLKNNAATVHDALQYGLTVYLGNRVKKVSKSPSPSYNFGSKK